MRHKRFFICVLNWGMGHATRCIPIIQELQKREQTITIGSDGGAFLLLKRQFPDLDFVELPAYDPVYSKGKSLVGTLLMQLPKFRRAIREEHKITEQIVQSRKIDMVISDNRYGCYSHAARSIFLTHQISLMLPSGLGLIEPFVNYYNRSLIKKFDRVWVPDFKDDRNLTANLSFSNIIPRKYVGQLSRMEVIENEPLQYDLMGLVSGPEPQRQIFEDLLRKQFQQVKGRTILVRGVPSGSSEIVTNGRHSEVDFLDGKALNLALARSKIILARSGYSTIMDLAKMGKQAIFVPTPGQTEQLYLGKRLMKMGLALMIEQSNLKLEKVLPKHKLYSGFNSKNFNNDSLVTAIERLLR